MRIDPRKAVPAAIVALLLACSVPAAAEGAPTRVTGGGEQSFDYLLDAAPGTANDIKATLLPSASGFDYLFSDSAGLVTPLFLSCKAPDGSNAAEGVHQTLICGGPVIEPLSDNVLRVLADDGDDAVDVAFGNAPGFGRVAQAIRGEAGNDSLTASGPPTNLEIFFEPLLDGGPGNDQLRSGGNHKIKGKGGVDKVFARNGQKNLKISCGSGSDKKESARVDGKDPDPKSC